MTGLESPSDPPEQHARDAPRGEPIGLRTRILAAVFGSLLLVIASSVGVMVVSALAERRWDDARQHAVLLVGFPVGVLMISAARSGRDITGRAALSALRLGRLLR